MSFDAYDGFVPRRVNLKGSCEDSDVMPFLAMCNLWCWKYNDVKVYGDVFLNMVRVEMVEWIPFWKNELSYECVQWM